MGRSQGKCEWAVEERQSELYVLQGSKEGGMGRLKGGYNRHVEVPFTPAEVAENPILLAEIMGEPGLITKEQMEAMQRDKGRRNRKRRK